MGTEEVLLKKYGVLLTITALAECLSRSAEGLRLSLRRESDWTRQINATKCRVGKRIYFRTVEIAKIFDGKIAAGTE